jgi:aryl-alcohol dehydrogenase-like predicted oxidoreductase
LQLEYSLLERTIERDYLPLAKTYGLATMAWSPLAGGRLTRKNAISETEEIISMLERHAKDKGVSDTSIALAGLLARDMIPVIGARSPDQLHQNLKAT